MVLCVLTVSSASKIIVVNVGTTDKEGDPDEGRPDQTRHRVAAPFSSASASYS